MQHAELLYTYFKNAAKLPCQFNHCIIGCTTNLVIMEYTICCWILSWDGVAPKFLHKEHLITDSGRRIHFEI